MKHKISVCLVRSSLLLAGLLQAQQGFTADAAPVAAIMAGTASQTFTGKLESEQALQTKAGTQVTGPNSWGVRREDALLIFDAPENDAHVAIIDLQAADANAALIAAWARYRPTETHALKLISPRAARDGWDERKVADYETSPNERLAIQAVALRRGESWTVIIMEGSQQTFEKRGAAISLIGSSVRPKGFSKETFAGRQPRELNAARIEEMRSFLEQSMKELGVPGVSFALLDHGKIVHEGGVGVRELGKKTPVDANTLFMAASNTKGMSTLLLSTLADEGKLRWDQPVTELYPAFKLGDEKTTKSVLVKHLVCACTGLPRQDFELLFEYRNATPETSLALLAKNSPTSGFGEIFQYNNLMASAAGYIGGHLAYPDMKLGPAYDTAMQKRIFSPLGMNNTTFDMARALRSNHASPHASDVDNKTHLIGMGTNYSVVPHRPAGGVWTSAHDLIRYVQLEANEGKLADGKQLVSSENLLMRRKPQVASGENRTYGMGLSNELAWGVPVVMHGGSLFGYKSNLYLLPETGIGAVLLTNSDEGRMLLRPFMRKLLEVVYDGKPEAAQDVKAAATRMATERAKDRERLVLPAEKSVTDQLARHYHSTELGALAVRHTGKETIVDIGEWKSVVASRKNDDGSHSLITTSPGLVGFEFVLDKKMNKRVLVVRDGQHDYTFIETTPQSMATSNSQ